MTEKLKIKDITSWLDSHVPLIYQEDYDNSGFQVGNDINELTGILTTLDITREVLDEAIEKKCNLVISHHPLIFKGIKQIKHDGYVEKLIHYAIKNDLSLYTSHTNLDNVNFGVNYYIADKLALKNTRVLKPKKETYIKAIINLDKDKNKLLKQLSEIERLNICESYHKNKIEILFPSTHKRIVESNLKTAKGYQIIDQYKHSYSNDLGSGVVGDLSKEVNSQEFIQILKKTFNLKVIKHTSPKDRKIKRVAFCGGSGGTLIGQALAEKADIYITGDIKYHDFFMDQSDILLADIGHYESEIHTKSLIKEILSEKFSNIVIIESDTNTNPIYYS